MDRSQIFSELKEILRSIDGHDDKVIDACTEESTLKNDLGLNSIAMLYIIIVIEEKYDISFENAHMDDFKTMKQVIDFIEQES